MIKNGLKKKKRVLVGMSGGVDSSVTAALLKKRGYDVIGITLQLLPKEQEKTSACCNLGAIDDARRVAAKLNIPHYVVNSRNHFEDKVINHFVDQYLNGLTPNPCVECNRSIKFDELYAKLKELNADYIATGHYCRRTHSPSSNSYNLLTAKDTQKDQSYFLYMIQSEQLKHILFPLGNFTKPEIREMARAFGLINADKPDSQEICFVSQQSYKQFIENRLDGELPKSGNIVDTDGTILGKHEGLYRYTIGQRRGLNINTPEPKYVLKIDAKTNTITVGDKDSLKIDKIPLIKFSIVRPNEDITGKTYSVKLRYQMTSIRAKVVQHNKDECIIQLPKSQAFIASGQSCVLYKKDRVIGGGIIK